MRKKKTKKEQEKKDEKEIYENTNKNLQHKGTELLEKCLEMMKDDYQQQISCIKSYDNKASLLLVVFVGLFTIFSCFIHSWEFVDEKYKNIFLFGLGATASSYIASFLFFIFTITGRSVYGFSAEMIVPETINTYDNWLKHQICLLSIFLHKNQAPVKNKVKIYTIGCSLLIGAVILTFLLALFLVNVCVG